MSELIELAKEADLLYEYGGYIGSKHVEVQAVEYIAKLTKFASLIEAKQSETVESQLLTIKALNNALGGEGSLTTDNLVTLGRLEATIAKQSARIAELEAQLARDEVVGGVVNTVGTGALEGKIIPKAMLNFSSCNLPEGTKLFAKKDEK